MYRVAVVATLMVAAAGITLWFVYRPKTQTVDATARDRKSSDDAGQSEARPVPAPSRAAERLQPAGHHRMVSLLSEIAQRSASDHRYLGDAAARKFRTLLEDLPSEASADYTCRLLHLLGVAELRLGNESAAIEKMLQSYEMLRLARGQLGNEVATEQVLELAVAYLRLGETENCCRRNTPESCIVPIRGGGIHVQQTGSRQAIKYFVEVLQTTPPRSRQHLRAQWLLNLAYMTLGEYPLKVPSDHLIPEQVLLAGERFPRFANIASRVGLDTFSLAGGAVADDFDNDGHLDLIVSTYHLRGQLRLFHNNRDGTFSDLTSAAGLAGITGGLNLVQADFDNDGNVDVLVLRGGWLHESGRHPNSLLKNNGDGTFTDVTFDAGLGHVHYPTQTASWADFDLDGDLDLFVGNESRGQLAAPSQLFRNNGDGTFADVAEKAGVTNDAWAKAVVWGDFDGDRWPDIYVSNFQGPNRLYHNNHDGTFTDVARQLNVTGPSSSFPAWFWDVDNDGALDIFVSAYQESIAIVAADYLGKPLKGVEKAKLYRGDGHGGFTDATAAFGLSRATIPMGSNFGDLDNDGFLEFYLGTGYPQYEGIMPGMMYWNRNGKRFADITVAGGFGHLQKGHAIVFADVDNDGDQDVFEQMGGFLLGDKFHDALYENPGFGNHWIGIQVIGTKSNRSGIGVRIRVEIEEHGKRRSVYKHVNSGGSFGANPLRQTIGLGAASVVRRLEVYWPASDLTQSFHDVPADCFVRIEESADGYRVFELDPVGSKN